MNVDRQTTEVREVDTPTTEVQRDTVVARDRASGSLVAQRVVWYVAGVIITLLALRFILFMLGANQGSGFVDFIYGISSVFAAPFAGIFPAPTYGQFFFDTASLVAMVVYALVAWGIAKLFTLGSSRTTTV